MMKINPDDNSPCSNTKTAQINPDDNPQDPTPKKQDQTFLTFEEIKARRQTAQSKYVQKNYFKAVFGDKN